MRRDTDLTPKVNQYLLANSIDKMKNKVGTLLIANRQIAGLTPSDATPWHKGLIAGGSQTEARLSIAPFHSHVIKGGQVYGFQ